MELELSLNEVIQDSPSIRVKIQHNEDELDALAKWLDNLIKMIRSQLDESSSTHTISLIFKLEIAEDLPKLITDMKLDHSQILREGSHTADTLATIRETLQSSRPIASQLVSMLNTKMILPLAQSAIRDLKDLREERRQQERRTEKYEAAVSRYASLSKAKDPNISREVEI